MENISPVHNQVNENINDLLSEIVNELDILINYTNDNIIIKILAKAIKKMNSIINKINDNSELIRNDISSLYNQMNNRFDKLEINNNQEIRCLNGRYIGQVLYGMPEGKGLAYFESGNKYEGEFRNGKQEGKGIFYWINGDIMKVIL